MRVWGALGLVAMVVAACGGEERPPDECAGPEASRCEGKLAITCDRNHCNGEGVVDCYEVYRQTSQTCTETQTCQVQDVASSLTGMHRRASCVSP